MEQIENPPYPAFADSADSIIVSAYDLGGGVQYYFAIKAEDEMGNQSGISNIALVNLAPVAPQIISTPDTIAYQDNLYSYTIEAKGLPYPNFTLLESPSGMVIVDSINTIYWTPADTGGVIVTIEASNTQGTYTQSYYLNVLESLCNPFDVNCDRVIDIIDIQILINRLNSDVDLFPQFDLNNDQQINLQDVKLLMQEWGQ